MNASSALAHYRVSAALAGVATMVSAAMIALMPFSASAESAPTVASQPAAKATSLPAEKNAAAPSTGAAVATVLEINGAIGPATSRYVTKALDAARAKGSRIVVLQIDTPGGLDTAMRDIIRAIRTDHASRITHH